MVTLRSDLNLNQFTTEHRLTAVPVVVSTMRAPADLRQ